MGWDMDSLAHGPSKTWDSIARAYVGRSPTEALALETFGELPQQAKRMWPDDGGLKNPVRDFSETLSAEKVVLDHFFPQRSADVTWGISPRTVLDLVGEPGFVYLGSPYSKYYAGHDAAAADVSIVAGHLMQLGLVVYAPIAHGHFISAHAELPQTWEFWKKQCQPMIDAASSLVVATMEGWQESVGLTHEIACFLAARKPVIYVDPDVEFEMARAA